MTRYFYEVVTEAFKSRLYFDIEFPREVNPELDGYSCVQTWIKLVCHCLNIQYNITCNSTHVIQMDATVETKFSNNIECGKFVKTIVNATKDYIDTGKTSKYLPADDADLSMEKVSLLRTLDTKSPEP